MPLSLRTLQRLIDDALTDVKGVDITWINTRNRTDLFDRLVVVTGTSNRHVRALAERVAQKVRDAGGQVMGMEGLETGEWVLVDMGEVIVHVMQPAVRAHYQLEELWQVRPRQGARAGAREPG
jgi:ribosome-associated protein